MPETQSFPKPLMVEKVIGARMDLPFGLGSARKLQKWQEEQANAEKVDVVKAEAEKIAAAKAAEAEAAKAAFAEPPTEDVVDVSDTIAATPTTTEGAPAPEEQSSAPEEPPSAPAPAQAFFDNIVGLFSQRDNKAE